MHVQAVMAGKIYRCAGLLEPSLWASLLTFVRSIKIWYPLHFIFIYLCRLLITFVNRLALHNVELDLGPKYLMMNLMVFLKEFFEKVDFEKNQPKTKKHEKGVCALSSYFGHPMRPKIEYCFSQVSSY